MKRYTEMPDAFVTLTKSATHGQLWEVQCCPFCGKNHAHGAGSGDIDPRRYLAQRIAKCETGSGGVYYLVERVIMVEKCWFVRWKNDFDGEFIFAKSRAKAIYESIVYADMGEWVHIRAVRVPSLDGKEINQENVEAAGYTWID